MSHNKFRSLRAALALLPGLLALGAAHGQAGTEYYATTYQRFDQNLSWITCGYNATSSGCFGSGLIGPFGRLCSVAGTNTRIVVADAQPASGPATLSIYAQAEGPSPSVTLLRAVRLPAIPASATARCEMALLGNFIYFGTNESASFVKVNLRNYSVTTGSSCGGVTSAIRSGPDAVVVSQSGCFTSFDPNGNAQLSGGEFTDIFVPGTNGFAPGTTFAP